MKRVLCALLLFNAAPALARQAPAIKVSFEQAGHVTVIAENATLGEILDEWSKAGGARLVVSQLPPGRRSVAIIDADEGAALDTLLEGLPGFVATKRTEVVAGRSRYESLKVLGQSVISPNAAPDPSQVAIPESLFEYAWPTDTRFPGVPDLTPTDPAALGFGTLPEGVIPEAAYDYALPSGTRLALPPGIEKVHENAAPAADLPMPEMRFQYARPTPALEDGSTAPPLYWGAVADAAAEALEAKPAAALPVASDPDSTESTGAAAPVAVGAVPVGATDVKDPTATAPKTAAKPAAKKTGSQAPKRPVTVRKPGGGR